MLHAYASQIMKIAFCFGTTFPMPTPNTCHVYHRSRPTAAVCTVHGCPTEYACDVT